MPNAFTRVLLLSSLALGACHEQPDPTAEFLRRHGGDDFSGFANTALLVRGFAEGEAIVFLYKPPTPGFAVYQYDFGHRHSRFVKFNTFGSGSAGFAAADSSLIQRFVPLNVTYLEVDPHGTVHAIVQAGNPKIELLKTQDISTATRRSVAYISKGGNWYESRSE